MRTSTTTTTTTTTTIGTTGTTATHHHQDLSVLFTPIINEAISLHSELIPYYSNLKVPRSLVEKVQSLIKKLPVRSPDPSLHNNNNNNNNNNIDSYVIQPLEFIYISHIYSILNLTKISDESLSILTEAFIQDMSADSKNNLMNYFTVSCFISGKHISLSLHNLSYTNIFFSQFF